MEESPIDIVTRILDRNLWEDVTPMLEPGQLESDVENGWALFQSVETGRIIKITAEEWNA